MVFEGIIVIRNIDINNIVILVNDCWRNKSKGGMHYFIFCDHLDFKYYIVEQRQWKNTIENYNPLKFQWVNTKKNVTIQGPNS